MLRLFGEKLRYLRKQRGVTQVELADELGSVRQSHLSLLEAGRREPSINVALTVAVYFGVSLDYLLRDAVPVQQVLLTRPYNTSPSSSSPQPFGQKLHHLRECRQMHQSEVAAALSLRTQSHISLLETGRSEPSVELAIAVADLFGVPLDYLLREDVPFEAEQ